MKEASDIFSQLLQKLVVVRFRSHHTTENQMQYDVRYEPYFECAGLLPFVSSVQARATVDVPFSSHRPRRSLAAGDTQLPSPLWRADGDVGGLCHDHWASH